MATNFEELEMTGTNTLRILTMGKYLPKVEKSADLERRLGIPEGYSMTRSGVETRCHVTFETNGYMGAKAAENALDKAGLSMGDIDLLISAGGTFDYAIPNQASVIKSKMKDGNKWNTPSIDIDTTCLSFITAFDMASKLFSKDVRRIMIVSSEIASKGLDPSNFESSTLFGDAAVACIVEPGDGSSYLIKGLHKTYSQGVYYTWIEGGGNAKHFKDHPYDPILYSFQMEGKRLLKMSKEKVPAFLDEFFGDLDMDLLDVDVIVPHQASRFGLEMIKRVYDFKPDQFKESISRYGNCIAASIPLTLSDCIDNGELKRGDQCLILGTSAGFSIGAVLFIY